VLRTPPKRLRKDIDSSLETIRRIQADVIPRAEERVERGDRRVSASIGRELKTVQRLYDSN
jgi:hypothetical protein